jgi:hypothetical protein
MGMAEALGLTVTAWSPLASGLLTGKYAKGSKEEKRLDKTPQFKDLSERKYEDCRYRRESGERCREISGAGGAELVARKKECHSHYRRAEIFAVRGQYELPEVALECEATGEVGRSEQD